MKSRKYVLKRLEEWAEYTMTHERDRGWPSTSTEARAMERAKGETVTNGIARWRGKGAPPQMPKETKPTAKSREPAPMWGYVPVDEMSRLLLDLFGEHPISCEAVKIRVLAPKCSEKDCANALRLSERTFRRRRKEGLEWLATWIK